LSGEFWQPNADFVRPVFDGNLIGLKGAGRALEMAKSNPDPDNVDERLNGSKDLLGPNSEIGRKLKQYYDGLVSEEVPDRFAQLLKQLEQTEPAPKKG
jgi:hypothetical protein